MKNLTAKTDRIEFWTTIKRGFFGKCPHCGKGTLFTRYLKQVESCKSCSESFSHISADDGPAWLSIVVVGHLILPIALAVESANDFPTWLTATLWPTVILVSTLIALPRAKGIFISLIWRTKCAGSEDSANA